MKYFSVFIKIRGLINGVLGQLSVIFLKFSLFMFIFILLCVIDGGKQKMEGQRESLSGQLLS